MHLPTLLALAAAPVVSAPNVERVPTLDPGDPRHCQAAFSVFAAVAEIAAPHLAPGLRSRSKVEEARIAADPASRGTKSPALPELLKDRQKLGELASACSARQDEAGTPVQVTPDSFSVAAEALGRCRTAFVQLGMRLKIEPAAFRTALAKSCPGEEAAFRLSGIQEQLKLGRTRSQAEAEIEGRLETSLRAFAADQESYINTGRVPR